jgi:phosphoglycerate dehydrogenase-like enzyme
LTEGNVGYAAIDVYENEPPSESGYKLAGLDNVVATPHIAYYTQEANDNSIKMTVESILEALKEPSQI